VEVRHHLGDLSIDGILKWILKKWGVRMRIRFNWLRIETSDVLLYNEYSVP
jgi:hypothetical protein